jgi:hypothetical protein
MVSVYPLGKNARRGYRFVENKYQTIAAPLGGYPIPKRYIHAIAKLGEGILQAHIYNLQVN